MKASKVCLEEGLTAIFFRGVKVVEERDVMEALPACGIVQVKTLGGGRHGFIKLDDKEIARSVGISIVPLFSVY